MKGRPYSVGELIGSEVEAQQFQGGSGFVVYLSPRDYHRVHAPVGGEIRRIRSIPGGDYFPVNDVGMRHVPQLFLSQSARCHRHRCRWGLGTRHGRDGRRHDRQEGLRPSESNSATSSPAIITSIHPCGSSEATRSACFTSARPPWCSSRTVRVPRGLPARESHSVGRAAPAPSGLKINLWTGSRH